MHKVAYSILAACLAMTAHVQAKDAWSPPGNRSQISIWPNGAPNKPNSANRAESVFEVKKASGHGYTGIANVSDPTITIFAPSTHRTDVAIIVFPGGGFQILAIDIEGTEICNWVTSKGMTCVLLKYRVPGGNHYWEKTCKCHITPPIPFALQDAQRAIKLVRSKSQELGIAPNKVGVIGFSAGGYLVAQTSSIFESSYTPNDSIDTLSSRPDFAIALYPGHLCRSGAVLDPSITVTKQTSPTFLLQAWNDPIDKVCNSTVYARALDDAGVPTEVHLFSKGGHAFGLRDTGTQISSWPILVENWLREIEILDPAR